MNDFHSTHLTYSPKFFLFSIFVKFLIYRVGVATPTYFFLIELISFNERTRQNFTFLCSLFLFVAGQKEKENRKTKALSEHRTNHKPETNPSSYRPLISSFFVNQICLTCGFNNKSESLSAPIKSLRDIIAAAVTLS